MVIHNEKRADGRSKKRPGIEEQTEIITAAAIELFVELGTKNTSIAQICSKSEVSKPTFYRCFKDKDALVTNLYQHSINSHVEKLLESTLNTPISSRKSLEASLDTLFDAIFERASLAQLLFQEYSDPTSPASKIIDDAFNRIAQMLEQSFQKRSINQPSSTFLKAMMSAFQWVAYDAIKAGLTPKKVKEAKYAAHELASAMFIQMANSS